MATGTWNTGSWGQNQWGDNANPTVIPTGFGMSAALGDESSTTEINLGWGRQEWGLQGWGIAGTTIHTEISEKLSVGTVISTVIVLRLLLHYTVLGLDARCTLVLSSHKSIVDMFCQKRLQAFLLHRPTLRHIHRSACRLE